MGSKLRLGRVEGSGSTVALPRTSPQCQYNGVRRAPSPLSMTSHIHPSHVHHLPCAPVAWEELQRAEEGLLCLRVPLSVQEGVSHMGRERGPNCLWRARE